MTTATLFRLLLWAIVLDGLVVNVREWRSASIIGRRLIDARVNGLRHQAVGNLLTSARHRLAASWFLVALLSTVVWLPAAPPLAPTDIRRAIVALALVGIAANVTLAGRAARRNRLKTIALIEATDAEAHA